MEDNLFLIKLKKRKIYCQIIVKFDKIGNEEKILLIIMYIKILMIGLINLIV